MFVGENGLKLKTVIKIPTHETPTHQKNTLYLTHP